MDFKYLGEEHLTGFEKYKYNCKDTSPLSNYIMHPFWNKVILICPKWIAPNLLTFLGFLFTVATFLLLSYYDYEFYASAMQSVVAPIPQWVFILSAINIFIAYTLDGIDGKQARRTGTSGPIGELFDHGLDSFTASLIPIIMYHVFGRHESTSLTTWRLYLILWNVLINFHLTHWEKYNTGLLFLPWGYDFSMWCAVFVFLVGGIWGHEAWHFTLPGNISSGGMFELMLYISSAITNVPVVFYNVYASYRDKTGYMRSFSESFRPFVSIILFFVMTTLWVIKRPGILEDDPNALFILIGTIFSNICCRLIVAQMSSTRCELYNWLLYPTGICIFASVMTQYTQVDIALLYSLLLLALLAHIHYGTCVVREMCDHFHINCFKIRQHAD
nr:ethanolaminephosphotransferase 1 [Onthophagus taurus]